jgi:single-strand DNA-binding protein
MNSINIIGNICNDLEVKTTQSGKSVLSFNIAVKRPFTKDVTDFIPCIVWNQSAEYLSKYGKKGSRCAVSGKLTTRKYQDKNGNNRTAFEVVADTVELVDGKNDAQGANDGGGAYVPDAYKAADTANYEEVSVDDDLPF